MIDKKKLPFFRLSLIFGIIILFTLMYEWSNTQTLETSNNMMNASMGDMMYSMHLSNVNINELIYQVEKQEEATGVSSHHNSEDSELSRIHNFTTISIIALLPLIIAGSIFLSIVWLK